MSFGGRARMRTTVLRRAMVIGAILVVLALVFLLGGHWVLGIIFGIAAAAAIWVILQARSVR